MIEKEKNVAAYLAKGELTMLGEKAISRIELAMLYELRLILLEEDKTDFTRDEILKLLDKIAAAKK